MPMRSILRAAVSGWSVAFVLGLFSMVTLVVRLSGADAGRVEERTVRPLVEARSAAFREGSDIATRLFMDEFVRTVAPAVVAEHAAGRGPSMSWPEQMDPGAAGRDSIESALRQVDLRRQTSRGIAVGLHVVEYGARFQPSLRGSALLGEHDGVPYCVAIDHVPDLEARVAEFGDRAIPLNGFLSAARRRHAQPDAAADLAHPLRSDLLDGCTFPHRFGMPGHHVRAWIAGRGVGRVEALLRSPSLASMKELRFADGVELDVLLRGGYDFGSRLLRACRSGNRAECQRLILPDGAAPGSGRSDTGISVVTGFHDVLLGHLESRFGPEAFEAFWASDEPIDVAFRTAFGVHPADFVQAHATRVGGELRAGPLPGWATLGAALLLMVGALAIGTRSALRRCLA